MAFFACFAVPYAVRFATYDSFGPVVSGVAAAAPAVVPTGAAEAATEGRKASEAVSARPTGTARRRRPDPR